MDAKALAKSKRAHSQQHSRKHHPNPKLKAPSGGATETDGGVAKKPSGKQVREKTIQSRVISGLPSNWDRYDEENDSGSEDPSGSSANKNPDVVLPKSKGADYRHLIAEAQSQSQSNLYPDSFPSVDDVLAGKCFVVDNLWNYTVCYLDCLVAFINLPLELICFLTLVLSERGKVIFVF